MPRPTPRTRHIATLFNIPLTHPKPPAITTDAPSIIANTITLITGTSGSGKSTLLRQIEAALRTRQVRVTNLWRIPLPRNRAMVDCFALPLRETLSLLARAGLAEAPLFLLPPAWLSEGQQFRYRLAQWFARVASASCRCSGKRLPARRGRHPAGTASVTGEHRRDADATHLLLADEFCSMLDRPTAKALAWQLAHFIRTTPRTAAIVATAHEDLIEDLQPDRIVRKELGDVNDDQ